MAELVPSARARAQARLLAGLQSGVLSREQALAQGLSDGMITRLVKASHWRRLESGLFLTADVDPGFEARAWAGVLIGGDHARIGGLAAARLHRLTDDDPDVVVVLVPHQSRVCPRPGLRFVRERPGVRNLASHGAPPRISVEDTVLDLAGVTAAASVNWVTVAVQRRLTTTKRLRRALVARERHPHRRVLLGLLEEVAQGAQSPLELTYLRDVERAHDLPRGVRQAVSADRSAVRDVLYEEYGVVVELDGRIGHVELGRFRVRFIGEDPAR